MFNDCYFISLLVNCCFYYLASFISINCNLVNLNHWSWLNLFNFSDTFGSYNSIDFFNNRLNNWCIPFSLLNDLLCFLDWLLSGLFNLVNSYLLSSHLCDNFSLFIVKVSSLTRCNILSRLRNNCYNLTKCRLLSRNSLNFLFLDILGNAWQYYFELGLSLFHNHNAIWCHSFSAINANGSLNFAWDNNRGKWLLNYLHWLTLISVADDCHLFGFVHNFWNNSVSNVLCSHLRWFYSFELCMFGLNCLNCSL